MWEFDVRARYGVLTLVRIEARAIAQKVASNALQRWDRAPIARIRPEVVVI